MADAPTQLGAAMAHAALYHVSSISGGKDSLAATLVMLATLPHGGMPKAVMVDTGNEHELTLEYIDYLRSVLMPIDVLRRDFTEEWWHRRRWIAEHYEAEGVPAALVERALAIFDRGPFGIPFLDLCVIKGRFPSRRAQFCTSELKTVPIVEYQLALIEEGAAVWSWQGIRAEESERRRHAPSFEVVGGGLFIHRPILRWSAADCFEAAEYWGLKSNPLYRLGMKRVGCMPCINASKAEVREIGRRFPQHVDRIEEWEAIVIAASKWGAASFFPAPDDGRGDLRGRTIRDYVQWSKTGRGGRILDLFHDAPLPSCSSAYGLCE